MHAPLLAFRAAPLLLLFALPACGSDPIAASPLPLNACKTKLAECLVNQQICVEGKTAEDARCEVCPQGQFASITGSCEPIEGTPLSHEFAEFTVGAGEEILGLCQSWTLNNETEIWVNTVELVQNEASHHSNWLFAPSDKFEGPDGVWKCKDRGYSQITAALAGGVLYAQSTQASKEVQRFPNGAALRIPPYSRIVGDVHLLNTTSEAVKGNAKLTLYSLPLDEVKIKLAPFHVTYDKLDIPAHSTSRFFSECPLEDKFQATAQTPFNMKIYYVLPHTHALGSRFFLELTGGDKEGQSVLDVKGFNSEARGKAYDPPVDVSGATGVRFGCEFINPRDQNVEWGFGDQEMCEALGFAESEVGFESRVSNVEPAGAEGDIQRFTGDCNTITFKWSHEKPGGPKP